MIITVVAVMKMEVVSNYVVDMVAVRNCLMSAARPVHVVLVVSAATVLWGTGVGIARIFSEAMFVHVVAVDIVHMSVVQIIRMPVVVDGGVTAAGTVLMVMLLVRVARTFHGNCSWNEKTEHTGRTLTEA
jgi:hypothetical protein